MDPALTSWRVARVVGVFPHPDDEAWAAGGLLARAVAVGADVRLVCATAGEKGTNRSGVAGDLGVVRTNELRASALALGITRVDVLGLPDGGLRDVALDLDIDADTVVALGDDGGYGHHDHVALTQALRRVVTVPLWLTTYPPGMFDAFRAALEKRRPGLCIDGPLGAHAPDLVLELSDDERARKLAAIASHQSQLPGGDPLRFLAPELMPDFLARERWYRA